MVHEYQRPAFKKRILAEIKPWVDEMTLLGFEKHTYTRRGLDNNQTVILFHTPKDFQGFPSAKTWLTRSRSKKGKWNVTFMRRSPAKLGEMRQEAYYDELEDALLAMKKWLLDKKLSTKGLKHATKLRQW